MAPTSTDPDITAKLDQIHDKITEQEGAERSTVSTRHNPQSFQHLLFKTVMTIDRRLSINRGVDEKTPGQAKARVPIIIRFYDREVIRFWVCHDGEVQLGDQDILEEQIRPAIIEAINKLHQELTQTSEASASG